MRRTGPAPMVSLSSPCATSTALQAGSRVKATATAAGGANGGLDLACIYGKVGSHDRGSYNLIESFQCSRDHLVPTSYYLQISSVYWARTPHF